MNKNTFTFTVTRDEVNSSYGVELTDKQWEVLQSEMSDFLVYYTQDELSRLIPEIDSIVAEYK